jgi:hypothetical protein
MCLWHQLTGLKRGPARIFAFISRPVVAKLGAMQNLSLNQFVKRTALVLLSVGIAVSLTACKTCPCKPGPEAVELFNGKDLSGWKAVSADPSVKAEDVWSVRDRVLVCKGEPMGYLHTEQSFTNYRLHLEYRWAPGKTPGNSGIFNRINGPPKPLPRCLEVQLKNGDAGDVYCFHGMALGEEKGRFRHVPDHELGGDLRGLQRTMGQERKPGDWNHVDVVVEGEKLAVMMNGLKVNEARGFEILAGPVGLQSEGGEIHFRNVRIKPLP